MGASDHSYIDNLGASPRCLAQTCACLCGGAAHHPAHNPASTRQAGPTQALQRAGHVGGLCAGLLLGYSMCPVYSPHALHGEELADAAPASPSAEQPAEQVQQQQHGQGPTFASSAEQAAPEQLDDSPTQQALLPAWARSQSRHLVPARNLLKGLSSGLFVDGRSEIRDKDERPLVSRLGAGVGFGISLFSIVAAKVLERTGTVPLPKDISLLDAIGS